MSDTRHFAVAGGGIAGLMAANALSRAGYRVSLFERAGQFEPHGAGIQLAANATSILQAFGFADALNQVAGRPERLVVRRGDNGHILSAVALGKTHEDAYGAPYLILHRADLHMILRLAAEKARGVFIQMGTSVSDVVHNDQGVTLLTERNHTIEEHQADALIGADGIRSVMRTRLNPGVSLKPRKLTAWRAMIPVSEVPADIDVESVCLWMGPDAHLVHYPIRRGQMINMVAVVNDGWQGEGWNTPGDRDVLAARFAGWAKPVRDLVEACPSLSRWALADMGVLRRWGQGPVTLMGDAAHPTLPFMAQGGAMAIEDAMTLARVLRDEGESAAIPKTLRKYERLRKNRTARVQREARRNDWIYHLTGPMAMARNFSMGALGPERLSNRYKWLFGHKA